MTKCRTISTALVTLILTAGTSAAYASEQASSDPSPPVLTANAELRFGQKAVVNTIAYGGEALPVGITVVKIHKGKPSDLKETDLPPLGDGMVPWYIRSVLSYAGKNFRGGIPSVGGKLSDGSYTAPGVVSGEVKPCTREYGTKLTAKHRTYAYCDIVLAPRGVKVVAADYRQRNADGSWAFDVTWHK